MQGNIAASAYANRRSGNITVNMLEIAGIATLVIGVILLAASAWYYRRKKADYRDAVPARGTVRELKQAVSDTFVDTDMDGDMLFREEENMHKGIVYVPVIEFTDRNGRLVEITGSGSNPPQHKPGDGVRLLYPASAPEKAVVDTFFDKWGILVVMLTFGLILTVFGALALLLT